MRTAIRIAALGGLCLAVYCAAAAPALGAEEFDKYAIESASASLSSRQAGAHPDFTTSFRLTSPEGETPYANTRDVAVHLPPGLIGNPQNFQPCSISQFGNQPKESECPLQSQVGIAEVTVSGSPSGTFTEPIYNMEPPGGEIVARLAFFAALYPTFVNVRVDPVDYSLVATVEGAPSASGLLAAATTLWGVPADPSHDEERLTPAEAFNDEKPVGGLPFGAPAKPFMTNPTGCARSRQLSITATSYQRPDLPSTKTVPFPEIVGCSKLAFGPRFTTTLTNPEAAAPTGLDATLEIPQDETPQGVATSTLRSAVVSLPEGIAINPAAGAGLAGCSEVQVGFGRDEASHCPSAAKIGSAEVDVPALEEPLHGAVYQRTPSPGHLFAFWLVTDEEGVHLKLPAEIEANPLTGQLTTRFEGIPALGGNPEVPFSALKLHVFGGAYAPLSTPAACGTYQTAYRFDPWSGGAASQGLTPMQVSSGCGKEGFSPGLVAGTSNPAAGSFSPLSFTLTRADGESEPQSIAIHLPQGLLAKLAGVALCPEAEAASGACPQGSAIGSVAVAAGYGSSPLWVPQPGKAPTAVYLAGPYKGAPYSAVAVVPAQAGPFDLGTVVTRAGLYVDPETALATVRTDPLPQILEGVPVSYRAIHVSVDRPQFTLNPTSCETKSISATVTATDGRSADPKVGFQATDCAKLPYKPHLKLLFRGQTKRTGNPAVSAVLTQKPHQANTRAAITLLPAGEFIDNAHIGTPCTRVQFNEDRCPKKSILGHAIAYSPLLGKPLSGPIYFRSNGGARELPDIVVDLDGALHIVQVGYIDSVKTGPESSRVRVRFLHIPDAPLARVKLSFFGGKRGLIENSVDLCRRRHRARLTLKGQNGRVQSAGPAIRTRCAKHRRRHSKHSR